MNKVARVNRCIRGYRSPACLMLLGRLISLATPLTAFTARSRTPDLINHAFVRRENGLAFGSKKSMCVDVRGVEVTSGLPFAPTHRVDPGLLPVTGLDWPAPSRRDVAATKNGGDWTVCAKFGLTKDEKGREVFDLVGVFRTQVEFPDARDLVRALDQQEKPALIIVDGVGIGLGIVQELRREMNHLVSGHTLMDQNVSGLKLRRFYASIPPMYDGLVRLPSSMEGLQVLLNEFAAFPNGRHDDQVDAVGNVAADRQLVIRLARQHGGPIGRLWPHRAAAAPPPPKSRDQELHERRSRYFAR